MTTTTSGRCLFCDHHLELHGPGGCLVRCWDELAGADGPCTCFYPGAQVPLWEDE